MTHQAREIVRILGERVACQIEAEGLFLVAQFLLIWPCFDGGVGSGAEGLRASEETGCTILGKAEFLNPGQSVKDRTAIGIIRDAEASGAGTSRARTGLDDRVRCWRSR